MSSFGACPSQPPFSTSRQPDGGMDPEEGERTLDRPIPDRWRQDAVQDVDRKVDAEKWLRAELRRRDRGRWVDPALGKTTLGDWAEVAMGGTSRQSALNSCAGSQRARLAGPTSIRRLGAA